jgi:hypothetical protein
MYVLGALLNICGVKELGQSGKTFESDSLSNSIEDSVAVGRMRSGTKDVIDLSNH